MCECVHTGRTREREKERPRQEEEEGVQTNLGRTEGKEERRKEKSEEEEGPSFLSFSPLAIYLFKRGGGGFSLSFAPFLHELMRWKEAETISTRRPSLPLSFSARRHLDLQYF